MNMQKLPPSREQLLYWLHEAAEIEHNLMCCYLYAAFSLKRVDPNWSTAQAQAVRRWEKVIMSVVYEEMTHLALVANIMNALGGPVHMGRPAFPIDAGPYPAGFVIRLQPFSVATIEHFKFLERPASLAINDAPGFEPTKAYRRVVPQGRLSPGPNDYDTVGGLYDVLMSSFEACVSALGESKLFIGDPLLQVDASLAALPGLIAVTDLSSARQAIATIVTQGEGAGTEHADSHFNRFTQIGIELAEFMAADRHFEPAWPAATNPVMNPAIHNAHERVHISEPRIAQWLDIGNALYTTSLRCLLQGFSATERKHKATWLAASFALMRSLGPVGLGLSARPASIEPNSPHAGLTFTPLRALALIPETSGPIFVAERLEELRQRALALPLALVAGETPASWHAVINTLESQKQALLNLAGVNTSTDEKVSAPIALSAPATAQTVAPDKTISTERQIEIAEGKEITIKFEGKRCIHARHCVLDAPSVFKANTPGKWIYPDTVSQEHLIAVALNCPSGAIQYERKDGRPQEAAPVVNQLKIRENGPYAINADIFITGSSDGYRATLCRCGQSQNKPWCDSSHVAVQFTASGEPKTGSAEPLAVRDGALNITPMKNGPLSIAGNLEICAGTGRTVARVTEAKLCRCGQSKNKPFCDLSHVVTGFTADGN
jgi:CDGSH-type Zn-finger protein/uncharacterized Fe-S cluster protein YjdI